VETASNTTYITLNIADLERKDAEFSAIIKEYQVKREQIHNLISLARMYGGVSSEEIITSEQKVPVRTLVKDYLLSHDIFTTAQIVEEITRLSPTVNANSIQGELSKAKSNGQVRGINRGEHQSLIFEPVKPEVSTEEVL